MCRRAEDGGAAASPRANDFPALGAGKSETRFQFSLLLSGKGQAVSLDVVLALVIFTISIAGVLHAESSISHSVADSEEFRRTQDRLIGLSDQLVLTSGEPDGWYNSTNIKSVGLAYGDHRLADDKLIALTRMTAKDLRGNLSTGPNSLYVQLLTSGGSNCTVQSTNLTVGAQPAGAKEQISIDRYVMTENSRNCTLRVTLWRP